MITLFLLGYILPMALVLLYAIYFEKDVVTVRDLFEHWGYYLIPLLNILIIVSLLVMFIKENANIKYKKAWDKFLNTKLK